MRFSEPYISGREKIYLDQVFESGHFAGNGPFGERVQAFLAARYAVPHVLFTHSCTAALEISALLLDFKPGDEVIMPSYTFCSTASAFVRAGARIRFCEVEPNAMVMDLDDAFSRVTARTRAIVPVHYAGASTDMAKLRDRAAAKKILVIEDAAQGLDARFDGRWLGTWSSLATLSFHETKNVHAGLGGALLMNDASYFERAELIWERGTNRSQKLRGLVDKYSWVELGSSFFGSELQAAFLLAQLESLEQNSAERRKLHEIYSQRLQPLADAEAFTFPKLTARQHINWHAFFIRCRTEAECDELREYLVAKKISAFIGYVPLHSSPMGQRLGNKPGDLPITEALAPCILRMPLHNRLSEQQVESVCAAIHAFYGRAR